jgi:exonuclease III
MKLSFLFWNTNGRKCIEEIKNLVEANNIDILILAENNVSSAEILLQLNEKSTSFFPQHPYSLCEKIKIYSNFHYDFFAPIEETHRITVRSLTLPIIDKITVINVHLGDKGNFNSESQSEMASELKTFIDEIESKEGHCRTVVVGDFNMNPFEIGLVKANGLNATMSHKLASQKQRTIQTKDYSYFYNPMWSLYGDLHTEIAGTYYYRRAELVNYQWNIFDQILIRPSLLDNFNKKSVSIISHDGKKSLITKDGIPDKDLYSDHLPIKFDLNF